MVGVLVTFRVTGLIPYLSLEHLNQRPVSHSKKKIPYLLLLHRDIIIWKKTMSHKVVINIPTEEHQKNEQNMWPA